MERTVKLTVHSIFLTIGLNFRYKKNILVK